MGIVKLLLLSVFTFGLPQYLFSAHIKSLPVSDTFPTPRRMLEKRRALMQMQDTASISAEQYSQLTGRKLLPFEKKRFEKMQVKRTEYLKTHKPYKFKIWGFFLGLFLGPLGVAAAYIFSKNKDFKISSWFGLIGFAIIASSVALIYFLVTYL